MLLMGKSTISTGPCSIAFCMFTRGYVICMFFFVVKLIGFARVYELMNMNYTYTVCIYICGCRWL